MSRQIVLHLGPDNLNPQIRADLLSIVATLNSALVVSGCDWDVEVVGKPRLADQAPVGNGED